MIKQIQLRGISRTPSDRMSEDGGLSESLNMYLDTAENAPAFVPDDVTPDLGLPRDLNAERIFIHKTANYENYIVVLVNKIEAYSPELSDEDSHPIHIVDLEQGESVNDITSIGNTLLISTTSNLYYVLYKNKEYHFLGNQIPIPIVDFKAQYEGENVLFYQSESYSTLNGRDPSYFTEIPEEYQWNQVDANKHTYPVIGSKINTFLQRIWSDISQFYEQHINPVFVRYTATLYDGTKLSSIPILLGAGDENPIVVDLEADDTQQEREGAEYNRYGTFGWTVNYNRKRYKIIATAYDDGKLKDWLDIIQSIDIYISRDVPWNAKRTVSHITDRVYNVGTQSGTGYKDTHTQSSCKLTFITDTEAFEKELLDRSAMCYLLESIPLRGSSEDAEQPFSQSFIDLLETKELATRDEDESLIVQKELLVNDDMKHYKATANRLDVFNNHLILLSPTEILSYGYAYYNSYMEYDKLPSISPGETYEYQSIFCINADGDSKYVYGPNANLFISGTTRKEYAAFQVFPDSRCTHIILKITKRIAASQWEEEVSYVKLPMIPHPYLDCAYLYKGLGKDLFSLRNSGEEVWREEDNKVERPNKIYLSETSNPFFFNDKGKYTFQSKVLGIAVATTALSQGQFGQFPLYVFTEDGIWAMEVGADGYFVSQKPLSREVCINPDSICPIDNAVVFVTSKTVMMIQGSEVMNISPYMNGRHYTPNESALNIIGKQEGFEVFTDAISDDDPFMSFIKDAKVAYDYTGQRLVFISPSNNGFQYVYKIDTQTWHKVAFEGFNLDAPLNSYPECLIMGETSQQNAGTVKDAAALLEMEEDKLWAILNGEEDGFVVLYSFDRKHGIDTITKLHSMGIQTTSFSTNYLRHLTVNVNSVKEGITMGSYEQRYACAILGITDERFQQLMNGGEENALLNHSFISDEDEYIDDLNDILDFDIIDDRDYYEDSFYITGYTASEQATKVYSFSTILDPDPDAERPQKMAKGILITRPFDLGMPDVYKSITSIKIRGDFDKGNVKYILQGSNDGRTFYTLNTLRGKSWRMFRIFILADLEPTERISWIDVDFEPRYNNRLR